MAGTFGASLPASLRTGTGLTLSLLAGAALALTLPGNAVQAARTAALRLHARPSQTPQPAAVSFPWHSVLLPVENGEDADLGENGGLYIPNTADLMKRSTAGDAPLFSGACSIAIGWAFPRAEYDVIRRMPVLLGNTHFGASFANRTIRIGYVTRADNGNSTNVGKIRVRIAGETAGGTVEVYSATLPTDSGDAFLIVLRFDGSAFTVDLWDTRTGAKTAGTPVAKPGAWAGITQITGGLGLGLTGNNTNALPDWFPKDNSDFTGNQNIPYCRGALNGLLFLDSFGSDGEWQAMALGGDPMTIWPTSVRRWFPLVKDGALHLTGYSNLPSPVAHADALGQVGTIHAGPAFRRQSAAAYLTADAPGWPALYPVRLSETAAEATFTLRHAGLREGAQLQARILAEDGTVMVRDWQRVAAVGTSPQAITLSLPLHTGRMRVQFRDEDGTIVATMPCPVVTGYHVVVNGQSQCDYTFGLRLKELGNATALNSQFDAGVGQRTFVLSRGRISGGFPNQRGIWHTSVKPGLVGDGIVAFANEWAAHCDYPLFLSDVSVSGTRVSDMLSDEDGGSGTDARDMADVHAILRQTTRRDAQDRTFVSMLVQFAHSSDLQTDYAGRVIKPMIDGVPTASVPDVDDWYYSGVHIDPDFELVHLPHNRNISSTALTDAPTVTDAKTIGTVLADTIRQNIRDGGALYGYVVGPEVDVHKLDGDVFTHPEPDHVDGSPWVARLIARGALWRLGLGPYLGPVQVAGAAFTDGTRNVIRVTFTGPAGMALATKSGTAAVSGFEVNNDYTGFSAAIESDTTVLLTKTSGAWTAGSTIKLKPGGPGNYGSNFTGAVEQAWIDGALLAAGGLVRSTASAITVTG